MARASFLIDIVASKVRSSLHDCDLYPENVGDKLRCLEKCLEAIRPAVRAAESRIAGKIHCETNHCYEFIHHIKRDDYDAQVHQAIEFIDSVKEAGHAADDVLDRLEYRILRRKAAEAGARGNPVSKLVAHAYSFVSHLFYCCFDRDRDLDELCEVVGKFIMLQGWKSECVWSADSGRDGEGTAPEHHQAADPSARSKVETHVGDAQRAGHLGSSTRLVGRDKEKAEMLDFLWGTRSRAKVEVLSIVGMGGMGKTTLAQWAYNLQSVKQYFNVMVWLHVSDKFGCDKIMAEIMESASIELPRESDTSFYKFQESLKKGLRDRRFLIVLDDMREVDQLQWEILYSAIKFGEKRSRVLITTRNQSTANALSTVSPMQLGLLHEEDCWSIMQVFGDRTGDLMHHPQMEEIGRKIAMRSGGIPLLAKMLGSLLRSNFEISYWRSILRSRLWNTRDAGRPLAVVQICYNELPEYLKRCFTYCAMFPGDYGFEKDRLVRIWMALGFILPSEKKKIEDIGRDYFDELLQRSFIQKKEHQDGYVIHDILHDFAYSVSAGEFYVREDCYDREKHVPRNYTFINPVRHVKVSAEILNKAHGNFPRMDHVHSLIVQGRFNVDGLANVLRKLPGLRVLVLSEVTVNVLPKSIMGLIHLRYLVLHKLNIEKLPESVCRLYHLQGLDVKYCTNLLILPSGLHNLVNLRHLKQ